MVTYKFPLCQSRCGVLPDRWGWLTRNAARKYLIFQEHPLRLPAGQTEKRDGSGRKSGRFRAFWRGATRSTSPRHPGETPKGKGPEIFRALVYGGAGGTRTPVRKPSSRSSTCVAVWTGSRPRRRAAARCVPDQQPWISSCGKLPAARPADEGSLAAGGPCGPRGPAYRPTGARLAGLSGEGETFVVRSYFFAAV